MKRFTTFLALLAIMAVSFLAYADKTASTETTSNEPSRVDTELAEISTHPQSYRLTEQATDRVNSSATIKIHSTAPLANNDKYVQLLPGSIRYFRTDGTASDDGEHAAITWSIDGKSHSTDIGRPGAVVMVVRSLDGVVTWYALQPEMRC